MISGLKFSNGLFKNGFFSVCNDVAKHDEAPVRKRIDLCFNIV